MPLYPDNFVYRLSISRDLIAAEHSQKIKWKKTIANHESFPLSLASKNPKKKDYEICVIIKILSIWHRDCTDLPCGWLDLEA